MCALYKHIEAIVGWDLAETIREHLKWPAGGAEHRTLEWILCDPVVREATLRETVPARVQQHLQQYVETPKDTAAYM